MDSWVIHLLAIANVAALKMVEHMPLQVSAFAFFRYIFKKVYSTTPNKYINDLRINKAKTMLENTDYTIDEISYYCGYRDYSYF